MLVETNITDLIILVLSCDKYSDCWKPFLECMEKFWSDCPYKVILGTDTDSTLCDNAGFDQEICCNKVSWSALLKDVLSKIESKYIMLLLEDQWLSEKPDSELIAYSYNIILNNSDVGAIYFDHNPTKLPYFDTEKKFVEIPFGQPYRMSVCPGIWEKDYLASVLHENESAWEFERMGSFREDTRPKKILVTMEQAYFRVGKDRLGAIEKGKWEREIVEFAKRENIDVDFSKRPIKSRLDSAIKDLKSAIWNICPALVVRTQNLLYYFRK